LESRFLPAPPKQREGGTLFWGGFESEGKTCGRQGGARRQAENERKSLSEAGRIYKRQHGQGNAGKLAREEQKLKSCFTIKGHKQSAEINLDNRPP